MGLLIVMKGLPLAYQKDMQEDKEGAMDALSALMLALAVPAADEVNHAVDAAYRDKYGRYPSYVEPMVAAAALICVTSRAASAHHSAAPVFDTYPFSLGVASGVAFRKLVASGSRAEA